MQYTLTKIKEREHKKILISQDLVCYFGGSDEDRTRYLLHAMEALSQVSYGPITSPIIIH